MGYEAACAVGGCMRTSGQVLAVDTMQIYQQITLVNNVIDIAHCSVLYDRWNKHPHLKSVHTLLCEECSTNNAVAFLTLLNTADHLLDQTATRHFTMSVLLI
ncbi:hypothetical protein M422DRAFT_243788 [Sphaerobolus stellatus SS14]|nr:hypothetical protein M422DRAFT_243788 [Sphaerobolus stellatus SS14]